MRKILALVCSVLLVFNASFFCNVFAVNETEDQIYLNEDIENEVISEMEDTDENVEDDEPESIVESTEESEVMNETESETENTDTDENKVMVEELPEVTGKTDSSEINITVSAEYDTETKNISKYIVNVQSAWGTYSTIKLDLAQVIKKAVSLKNVPHIYIKTDVACITLEENIIKRLANRAGGVYAVFEKNMAVSKDILEKLDNARFELGVEFEDKNEELLNITEKFDLEIPYTLQKEGESVKLHYITGNTLLSKGCEYKDGKIICRTSSGERLIVSEGIVVMITGRTLDLQGTISMIFYSSLEGVNAKDARMLFWDEPQDEYVVATAQRSVSYSGKDSNGYRFEYDNISSKDMNKKIYARLMAKDSKGNVVYSSVPYVGYSVVSYAENMIKNEQLRPLLVKMLNYGAAAQQYFGSDKKPANSILPENEKVMDFTKVYMSEAETIPEATKNGKCSARIVGKSLMLEGDISINYYVSSNEKVDEIGVLFWTEDAYNRTKNHIAGSQSLAVKNYWQNGEYKVFTFGNIVSSQMFEKVYARIYTRTGNIYKYSDIDKYSVKDYAANQIEKSTDKGLVDLLRRLLIYGEEAEKYFRLIKR